MLDKKQTKLQKSLNVGLTEDDRRKIKDLILTRRNLHHAARYCSISEAKLKNLATDEMAGIKIYQRENLRRFFELCENAGAAA